MTDVRLQPGRTEGRRTSYDHNVSKKRIHHPKIYQSERKIFLALLSYIQAAS